MGIVMSSNASFSDSYVTDQLTQQKITFKAAASLTDEEKASPCLVKFAGQPLTTGKQAECYANEFIGLHVKTSAGGRTYAELGDVQSSLRTQVAAAQTANDPGWPTCRSSSPTPPASGRACSRARPCGASCSRPTASASWAKAARRHRGVPRAGLMLLLSLAGLRPRLRHSQDPDLRRSRADRLDSGDGRSALTPDDVQFAEVRHPSEAPPFGGASAASGGRGRIDPAAGGCGRRQ